MPNPCGMCGGKRYEELPAYDERGELTTQRRTCRECLGLGRYETAGRVRGYDEGHMIVLHSTRPIEEILALLPEVEPDD